MTREVNCMNCMIGRFKYELCDEKMCEALKRIGESDDFVDIIMLAKELVRCKDCYHYDKGENESESWQYCRFLRHNTSDDDFCSWGERREP